MLSPGQAFFRAVPRAGPWAECAAQARARLRAVPGTGTMPSGLGWASVVLFRAVPVSAHRAWPIWKTIHACMHAQSVREGFNSGVDVLFGTAPII